MRRNEHASHLTIGSLVISTQQKHPLSNTVATIKLPTFEPLKVVGNPLFTFIASSKADGRNVHLVEWEIGICAKHVASDYTSWQTISVEVAKTRQVTTKRLEVEFSFRILVAPPMNDHPIWLTIFGNVYLDDMLEPASAHDCTR